ncbi:TPA: LysR family transcriptional regulator [Serratia marcescens]
MHSPSRARLPKLSAILAFETAARTGSLARAADALALTAAAVSQQIRQLEQHLGITLFIRAKSGVTLTEQGADYLAYVQEAFETLRVAQQHVERQRGKQALTVFALPALASKWLNPALGDWLAQCPDGDLRLHATHAAVDFAHSAADFALCFGDQDYPLLEKVQLFQDRVQPVCSPALRDRGDWAQLPLLHVDWGKESQFLPGWHEWFTAADRMPPPRTLEKPGAAAFLGWLRELAQRSA